MKIEGYFSVDVDMESFAEYTHRYGDDRPPLENMAENYIAVLILGMYRGSTPESANIKVTSVRGD